MDQTTQIKALEERVLALIADNPSLFLVEIWIKPTNNIKIYIDGNQGVTVETLVSLNRKLYHQLEEEGVYPDGNFSLELSSPGLDEPLKLHRQYIKNIGRFVEVLTNEGVKIEGKMNAVTEENIEVEETKGKGKKQEIKLHTIPFTDIKSTKIQIKF
jgi:ribosome maturation factor RimP